MQIITIKTKVADFKAGKYVDQTHIAVVASTKSANNAKDEIQKTGATVVDVVTKDIFLDKEKTRNALKNVIEEQYKELPEPIKTEMLRHVMNSLDTHCVFYRPNIALKNKQ